MKVYAAYYPSEVREISSSGGLFSLIAANFDVVYGVAMTKDCYGAEMIRVEKDIAPLRGSKYVQAKMGNAFRQVKADLDAGKRVLFSGTGCQVNGLKKFLGTEYPGLFAIDVVCYGAPPQKLWEKYAAYREAIMGEKLTSVSFRCKDHGWAGYELKQNEQRLNRRTDPFMQMFLRDYCLRPSCYQCRARQTRMADLTMADFWGIHEVAPEMNDDRGVSLVITRSSKGQSLFDGLKTELIWKEVPYEDGVRSNPAEYQSPRRPPQRDTFFRDLDRLPFAKMCKKYASPPGESIPFRAKRKLKKIIKRLLGRE